MKLTDFTVNREIAGTDIATVFEQINDTGTDYPRNATIHQLFSEQAEKTPDAIAVRDSETTLTYRELDRKSNQLARFLQSRNPQNEFIAGLLMNRSAQLAVCQLGIVKAGGAYLPLTATTPFSRIRTILEDAGATLLLFESEFLRDANKLQWECPELQDILCIDSDDLPSLREETGAMMKEDTWKFLRREMHDDISGGGWRSSFTGELLSREVMDEYADNIETKLSPRVDSTTRILEIGCASGMSLFRLAPRVSHYYGTELTGEILEWTESEAGKRGIGNITLRQLAAHEIHLIDQPPFDVVIMNSVIQCFSGHNYLRDALRQSMDAMGEKGLIFLGNVWDQKLKDRFTNALEQFQQEHMGEGYTTKTDRYEELFLAREWFRDLQTEWPQITGVEFSPMIATHQSELSDYSYDVILTIDKSAAASGSTANGKRSKYQFDRSDVERVSGEPVPEMSGPNSLANLMYTSGSTGKPKGVMVEHRNVIRLVTRTNYISVTPDDRILQTGAPSFDASTLETFLALLNGAELIYPKQMQLLQMDELASLLQEKRITITFMTVRLFNLLAEQNPDAFDSFRVLMVGGERVSPKYFNMIRERYPELTLVNGYGPTENTGFSTCHIAERTYESDVPIGVPVSNSTVYILDENLNMVPKGMAGELYTGGDGVARGYANQPAFTAERFIPNPFRKNDRLYKTGDLVRLNHRHEIEFIGRKDNQLKIRGNRIEPGEVEQLLLTFSHIAEAVVVPVKQGEELVLGAYLVCRGNVDLEVIRNQLKRKLPEPMIPAFFQVLDRLPMNSNGKLDRGKLPPFSDSNSRGTKEPPATDTERVLMEIWQDVLDRKEIGVDENFFDIGGHSLSTTQLVSAIDKKLTIPLPLTILFTANTIRTLATYIDNLKTIDIRIVHEEIVPLSESENGRSVFAFPPGSGYALAYSGLAPLLQPFGMYGLSFIEKEHRLNQYVNLIRRTQKPPYILLGYSGGGKLAYMVAQELERQGESVERVVMVDSARYVREVPVSDADVQFYASEFLEGITSDLLRQRVLQKMKNYRSWLANTVETGSIRADIFVIRGEDSDLLYYGPDGEPWATMSGWEENTTGTFRLLDGHGTHKEMLNEPNLARNAEIIKECLMAAAPST